MKYPKYRLAFPGKHVWVFNGHPMTQFNGYKLNTTAIGNGVVSADKTKGYYGESATLYVSAGPHYTYSGMEVDVGHLSGFTYVFGRGDATLSAYFKDSTTRYVVLQQGTGGTITAIPMTGLTDDEITLSSNSNPHYTFNAYSITGATLTGNKFRFGNSDVTAKGSWIEDPRFTAFFKQTNGGKLSGTPTTGYNGDVVTLVINPSSHYSFVSANLTGATLTGNTFAFNGSNVSAEATWLQDPIYTATLVQRVGGRISAVPLTGFSGDIITLSNTPSSHYTFNGYAITGGVATGNQVRVGDSNLTIAGNFVQDPIRSLSIMPSEGGSIGANKMSGFDNDVVTLSNTANTAYNFTRYDLTGATLTSNQFKFNGNNVTAKGVFTQKPTRSVTINQQTGGTIQATPTTGYDGTIVTLSNTANVGYTFNKYNITGATLTGNRFTLTGNNVTIQPVWTHNVYSLTLQNDGHGTLAAGKTTGYYNDTTTLTPTPNANYAFANYSVTGGSISNNTYTWAASNGTAKANFTYVGDLLPYYSHAYKIRKTTVGYNVYDTMGYIKNLSDKPVAIQIMAYYNNKYNIIGSADWNTNTKIWWGYTNKRIILQPNQNGAIWVDDDVTDWQYFVINWSGGYGINTQSNSLRVYTRENYWTYEALDQCRQPFSSMSAYNPATAQVGWNTNQVFGEPNA
jgi:hypothetical protein